MFSFLVRWVITAVSLVITAYLVPGIKIDSFGVALLAAVALGLINAIVRPILVLLTLPLTILTLGLFIFVINALSFSLASYFIPGFHVSSFFAALFGSIVVSIVSGILNHFFAND
ncbi:phage holin family protein [Pannus brasiliensis CCIBt3594]|uniref:Phage holin family protein n=1 Tax=Pannus brasiliensis CCIBt3594 TaxID=1427578 RepID=A0AAW9QMX4_9CHRO